MNDKTTIDSIMEYFTRLVENKQPIDPSTWLEGAERMNVLLQGEQELLFTLEQEVANNKKTLLDDPTMTVAKAKVYIEASNEYRKARIQKAKIDRCIEAIRIAKLQSRTASDLMRNSL